MLTQIQGDYSSQNNVLFIDSKSQAASQLIPQFQVAVAFVSSGGRIHAKITLTTLLC